MNKTLRLKSFGSGVPEDEDDRDNFLRKRAIPYKGKTTPYRATGGPSLSIRPLMPRDRLARYSSGGTGASETRGSCSMSELTAVAFP